MCIIKHRQKNKVVQMQALESMPWAHLKATIHSNMCLENEGSIQVVKYYSFLSLQDRRLYLPYFLKWAAVYARNPFIVSHFTPGWLCIHSDKSPTLPRTSPNNNATFNSCGNNHTKARCQFKLWKNFTFSATADWKDEQLRFVKFPTCSQTGTCAAC